MKNTRRKFVSNRYKANATCPCGKDNKNGRFATEKGFEISKDCELWFKNVLIAEKDDIADYYLKKYSQHFEPIN